MGEVDAAYLKGLRGLPEADLRELGRFMATVRREPEQNAARAELQRRHMKREADRIARAAERLADPVQTSTGAALARALLAAYIRKQEA